MAWFQVAFVSDLDTDGILPVQVGRHRLMVVRRGDSYRCFDATCPHRGASLAHGGRLDANSVICPFHGHHVCLGEVNHGFWVRSYSTFEIGGLVFVHLGDQVPLPLEAELSQLAQSHRFVCGFKMSVHAPYAIVIENAFDATHFETVHQAACGPMLTSLNSDGVFCGRADLTVPMSPWQKRTSGGRVVAPLVARAFGSSVVVSTLGGPQPYTVITSSTPQPGGAALVRLTMAIPVESVESLDEYMIRQAKRGLEADQLIWEHMDHSTGRSQLATDASVESFRMYCSAEPPIE